MARKKGKKGKDGTADPFAEEKTIFKRFLDELRELVNEIRSTRIATGDGVVIKYIPNVSIFPPSFPTRLQVLNGRLTPLEFWQIVSEYQDSGSNPTPANLARTAKLKAIKGVGEQKVKMALDYLLQHGYIAIES